MMNIVSTKSFFVQNKKHMIYNTTSTTIYFDLRK